MRDYDYIILYDENGEPYLEHAWLGNAWQKTKSGASRAVSAVGGAASNVRQKGAKYYDKIKEGAKTRYFYSKAELDAYYNRGKQKAQDLREKADHTLYNARRTASNVANNVKTTASKGVQGAKNAAGKAIDSAKDKLGFDERERMNQATMRYEHERDSYPPNGHQVNKASEAHDDARTKAGREAFDAVKDYYKTPIGMLDSAVKGAKNIASNIGDKASELGGKVADTAGAVKAYGSAKLSELGDTLETAKNSARETAGKAADAVSDFAYDAKDTAGRAIASARETAQNLLMSKSARAQKAWDDAYQQAVDAQKARSDLEYEYKDGEYVRRTLSFAEQRELEKLRKEESAAIDALNAFGIKIPLQSKTFLLTVQREVTDRIVEDQTSETNGLLLRRF